MCITFNLCECISKDEPLAVFILQAYQILTVYLICFIILSINSNLVSIKHTFLCDYIKYNTQYHIAWYKETNTVIILSIKTPFEFHISDNNVVLVNNDFLYFKKKGQVSRSLLLIISEIIFSNRRI